MKILLITDLYPIKRGDGNSPITLHNFAFEWIKQGHQVCVVKPNFLFNSFLRKKPFYKTGFYEYEGVKIFNVNYLTPFLLDAAKKLSKAIDIDGYDMIVAHMPSGIILADKLAKKFNKPLVSGVHFSDIEVLTNPIYKYYFKEALENAYKNSNKIACRSFVLQKKFSELYPELAEKTFVASSGVNEEYIFDKELNFSNPVKILTCANLIKRKNIDKLILAVNDLDGFELTVIGDGIELKNLKKLESRSGIPARQQEANVGKIASADDNGQFTSSMSHSHYLSKKILNLFLGRVPTGSHASPESQRFPLSRNDVNRENFSPLTPHSSPKFLGKLPHEKVLEEMRKSDIFVLPSVNETFGMVYLEAIASGCVTVCTNDDGVDGIIVDEKNGFLTEPTADGIKETLLKIKKWNDEGAKKAHFFGAPTLGKILENANDTVKVYTSKNCAKSYIENCAK